MMNNPGSSGTIIKSRNLSLPDFYIQCTYVQFQGTLFLKSYINEILEMVLDKDKTWSSKSFWFLLLFFLSHMYSLRHYGHFFL